MSKAIHVGCNAAISTGNLGLVFGYLLGAGDVLVANAVMAVWFAGMTVWHLRQKETSS